MTEQYDMGDMDKISIYDSLRAEIARLWQENERLRARLTSELVHKCFVCEEQDSPREGCDCVCCTIRRAEVEIERLRKLCESHGIKK